MKSDVKKKQQETHHISTVTACIHELQKKKDVKDYITYKNQMEWKERVTHA